VGEGDFPILGGGGEGLRRTFRRGYAKGLQGGVRCPVMVLFTMNVNVRPSNQYFFYNVKYLLEVLLQSLEMHFKL
jgi:hypothetical protein